MSNPLSTIHKITNKDAFDYQMLLHLKPVEVVKEAYDADVTYGINSNLKFDLHRFAIIWLRVAKVNLSNRDIIFCKSVTVESILFAN